MKLLRVGTAGAERPALLDGDGVLRDLSGVVPDVDGALLADDEALARVRAGAGSGVLPALNPAGLRVGPPVARIGKLVCIGLNYRDHAEEAGAAAPEEPIVFLKAADTVVGPHDVVRIPRGSTRTDWEVELAVVVGREASCLSTDAQARAAIAGYAAGHDVSERGFQFERGGGQWAKGKNCPTFSPLGPWLVTADEVPDPQALGLRLWVNGVLRQNGSTADQIFPVAETLRHVSAFMTLYPGDVLLTGTPAGVAMGQPEPKPYLRPGDVVELEVDGLGRQRQELKAAP
jgi:2-keto-4-pentenoate hydratase/2-oxohepta-3-ene-1,7-dioic acid hydratase in catechol pathway